MHMHLKQQCEGVQQCVDGWYVCLPDAVDQLIGCMWQLHVIALHYLQPHYHSRGMLMQYKALPCLAIVCAN